MTIHQNHTVAIRETAPSALLFPPDFRFGVSTAAYQIEGAAAEDGRTASIWDTYCRTPGMVKNGDTGDLACDHYHRMPDDVALMRRLGVERYRFSTSWSRVQPGGRGPLNQRGVDFYRRLVDELLAAGIEPWLTLYHWDLPQELEDAGGWPVRDTAYRFADYAVAMHGALGDRVTSWTTLNEPWCSAFLGYGSGDHAPGRHDPSGSLAASHHLLLGHGLAVGAMRAAQPSSQLGVTLNLYAMGSAGHGDADLDAVRRIDGLMNRWFLDSALLGRYPADVIEDVSALTDMSFVQDGDMDRISTPLDFLGINYYTRHVVTAGEPDGAPSPWPGSEHVQFVKRGLPVTAMDWEIDAPGLLETLQRVHRDYPPVPLYVTENGAAFADEIALDGTVPDPDRVRYFDEHLRACHEAIAAGVPLARLLRLVAHGQLRVGTRLFEALRHGLRRLPYATADH